MNLQEMKEWAESIHKKSNLTFRTEGFKDGYISKIRSILKQGIVDRIDIISKNTVVHNRLMNDIDNFLDDLAKLGVYPPQSEKEKKSILPGLDDLAQTPESLPEKSTEGTPGGSSG